MNCSKYHFTFLCPDDIAKSQSIKLEQNKNAHTNRHNKKRSDNVNVSCIWVNESTLNYTGQDSILPTFTLNIKGTNARSMKDIGCQGTFVVQSLADELQLKVIKSSVDLVINGFNSTEKVKTTVVEVPLDHERYPIKAICVPEIRTNLKLPTYMGRPQNNL